MYEIGIVVGISYLKLIDIISRNNNKSIGDTKYSKENRYSIVYRNNYSNILYKDIDIISIKVKIIDIGY